MVGRSPNYTALALLFSFFLVRVAQAQVPASEEAAAAEVQTHDAKKRAAALFDRAVKKFDEARYLDAAQLFLEADALWPSSDALSNAISSALKGNQLLLAARAADRALARHDVDPHTVQAAHKALAQVTPKLSRLDVECAPLACHIQIDSSPADRGVTYVLPGRHEVVGETTVHTQVVHHVDCSAGAICHLALKLKDEQSALTVSAASEPDVVPTQTSAPQRAPSELSVAPEYAGTPRWQPLSALIGSAVGAGTFVALTTWSGIDTLAARDLHETDPAAYDPDDVQRRARRTDILLAGSVVFVAATAVSSIWWLRFKASERTRLSLVPAHGVSLVAEHHF
jgi:hypothetical protein